MFVIANMNDTDKYGWLFASLIIVNVFVNTLAYLAAYIHP